jgi:hypothetical protein
MRLIDLAGQRFGRLVVLRRVLGEGTRWEVRCDCGTIKTSTTGNLRSNAVTSCGCRRREVLNAVNTGRSRHHDLTGKRFGRWVVLSLSRVEVYAYWSCQCDCGTIKEVLGKSLTGRVSQSCGCLQVEKCRKKSGYASQTYTYILYKHNSAKRRGLVWAVSREQFNKLTQQPCHYCDSPPSNHTKAKNGNGDFVYNGLDRKDSNLGYTVDNVVPCCKICQRAKMDMPYDGFMTYLRRLGTKYGSIAA